MRLIDSALFTAWFWNRKTTTDLSREIVGDLTVTRHGLNCTSLRIGPERMRATLSLEAAPMPAQMYQEAAALHSTTTVSRRASGGIARRPSVRRSSSISAIASERLSFAPSFVCPCPFAPGTSGQYAMYHSPSRSITAVNSLCIS